MFSNIEALMDRTLYFKSTYKHVAKQCWSKFYTSRSSQSSSTKLKFRVTKIQFLSQMQWCKLSWEEDNMGTMFYSFGFIAIWKSVVGMMYMHAP